MNDVNPVLHQYQVIADISGRMLAQARADQWEQVVALGKSYQNAVDVLRHIKQLDDSDRAARKELLIKILDDDASIRKLVSPAMGRLEELLGNMKRHQAVLHTYCSWSLPNQQG
jgi:flagellar protein FliT